MTTALKIENVSKMYRLGTVGTGTLSHDLNRWWAMLRGRPDPALKIGATNDRTESGGEHVWALKDINLEVKQGEILGIIGRNGAGKSTLLKLLSRVTAPTTGAIKSRGRIASLLEVGTGFHPELTGRENVYLNGAIMGMTQHEVTERLDEIVKFSGCAKYIDTPVKRYSSGMTVRLGFAVAAHLESEILIVDEVLAVGDAEFQKKCIGKMQEVGRSGRTIIFVSHNMISVQNLCQRCAVIENGKVRGVLPVVEAVEVYLNANRMHDQRAGAIIKSVEVQSRSSEGQCVPPDEPIEFVIELDFGSRVISELRIGLGVNDSFGNRIATIATYLSPTATEKSTSGFVVAKCSVAQLPLAPGEYNLKVAVGGKDSDLEVLENIFSFQVRPVDFFGNGKVPSKSQGTLLVKSEWQFVGEIGAEK